LIERAEDYFWSQTLLRSRLPACCELLKLKLKLKLKSKLKQRTKDIGAVGHTFARFAHHLPSPCSPLTYVINNAGRKEKEYFAGASD
jgi:hypothetical protein